MPWLFVGAALVLIALWFVGSYNGFIRLRNKCDEAFATMDVYLKKRYDMIPNLVEIVKQYAAHERQTLENVIKARNMAISAQGLEERSQSENMLSGTLRSLFALSENYPQLKADTSFLELQNKLYGVEGDIAQSRKYYNAVVKSFNIKVESFPSNLIAGMMNFRKLPFFTADEAERKNVQIHF